MGSPIAVLEAPVEELKMYNLDFVLVNSSSANPMLPKFRAAEVSGVRVVEYPVHKAIFFAGHGSAGLTTLLSRRPILGNNILTLISMPTTMPVEALLEHR